MSVYQNLSLKMDNILSKSILNAARIIYFEGKEKITINDIAKRVQVRPKIIKKTFGTVEDLLIRALAPEGTPPTSSVPDESAPKCLEKDKDLKTEKMREEASAQISSFYNKMIFGAAPKEDASEPLKEISSDEKKKPQE